MGRVSIIDYGTGNIRAFAIAIETTGGLPEICRDPESVIRAEKLLLPGVGAFKAGYEKDLPRWFKGMSS